MEQKKSHGEKKSTNEKKKIAIALQGGGSHGAFSWGVLDRLLEDGRFEIEGVTGTSAGGMNAVALAQGILKGGNQGGREALESFWKKISEAGESSLLNQRGPIDRALGKFTMYHSPGFVIFDYLSRIFSPYELNPLKIDPLKDIIVGSFDFEALRQSKKTKLYLCATHVKTGKLRIFRTHEISPESLLATACLPTIHSAVKVDGEYYWDGGFIGNPVFFPLIYDCETPDIMLIQLNPTVRDKLPITAREIADRLNEITNNATVVREMRAISFITDLIDSGELDPAKHKRLHMHLIESEEVFAELGWSSKLNTEWEFLTHLFEKGRLAAEKWIKEHYNDVGKKTTASIRERYAGDAWTD
jgi:NTE family protein